MKENRKHLVGRFAATTAVAGTLALGGLLTTGTASAATVDHAGASVLTNVTPNASADAYLANKSCCQSQVNNIGCC